MCDALPKVTPEVQRLIDMDDEMITAKDLSPILKMHPQTIVDRAKSGLWDQDHLGKFVLSGDRVKFFRKDFLQKCGFIEKEPEKDSTEQLLSEIIRQLKNLNRLILHQMSPIQKLSLAGELMKEEEANE